MLLHDTKWGKSNHTVMGQRRGFSNRFRKQAHRFSRNVVLGLPRFGSILFTLVGRAMARKRNVAFAGMIVEQGSTTVTLRKGA